MKTSLLTFSTIIILGITAIADAQESSALKNAPIEIQTLTKNYTKDKTSENLLKLVDAIVAEGDYKNLSLYSKEISEYAATNNKFTKYRIYQVAGQGDMANFEKLIRDLPKKTITEDNELALAITKSLVYLLNVPKQD